MNEIDVFWGRCDKSPDNYQAARFGEPHWREDNTCSFCGGIKPSIALEWIKQGHIVTPTDKNYKMYVEAPNEKVGQRVIVGSAYGFKPDGEGWVQFGPEHADVDRAEHHKVGEYVQIGIHRPLKTVKCYFNHFSESQAVELVMLDQEKKIHFAVPGHFYSGLCFGRYKEAINLAIEQHLKK